MEHNIETRLGTIENSQEQYSILLREIIATQRGLQKNQDQILQAFSKQQEVLDTVGQAIKTLAADFSAFKTDTKDTLNDLKEIVQQGFLRIHKKLAEQRGPDDR